MQTVDTSEQTVHEILTRGVEECVGRDVLLARLKSGVPLRVKLGIDPTSPNMHLGRAVALLKLRDFQQAGHTVVLIVGDFTGVIGDTSDKESERPMLTREVIEENKKHYFEQAGKLIDLSRAELRHNTEWLSPLTYREIGEHADLFSVADFIARENIKKRLDAGKRVSLREVLYPLMQGYDSVAVRADVELGGTDQRFNMLAGRTLQEHFRAQPQAIITNPLIAGLDGRKMSSSWGNTINLFDAPEDMYGKVMSVRDELISTYFDLCTRVPMEEVSAVRSGLEKGVMHPKDAKMRLAREVVTLYHDRQAADIAEASFIRTFAHGGTPDEVPTVTAVGGVPYVDLLLGAGIVSSRTEWRRLVQAGAVQVVQGEGEKTRGVHEERACVESGCVLRVGKRRFVRIEVR